MGLESALGNDGDLGGAIIRGSSNHKIIERRPVRVNNRTLVHVQRRLIGSKLALGGQALDKDRAAATGRGQREELATGLDEVTIASRRRLDVQEGVLLLLRFGQDVTKLGHAHKPDKTAQKPENIEQVRPHAEWRKKSAGNATRRNKDL